MVSNSNKENLKERRKYPRTRARCQINYFARTTGNWSEAELHDLSAGGICFICSESLKQDTKVTVQISNNAKADVPAIAASAVVVRCEQGNDHQYKVACKFSNARRENTAKISRFGFGFK